MRLEDPIVLVLVALLSWEGLKWSARVIIEAIANARREKLRQCPRCGELVPFAAAMLPPIKLPTRADLYVLAGQVAEGMAAAEGGPLPGVGRPPPTLVNSDGPRIYEPLRVSTAPSSSLEETPAPPLPSRVRDS